MSQTSKVCIKCRKKKPLKEFHRAKGYKDGRRSKCRKCISAAVKVYNSKPGAKERKRKYRKDFDARPGSQDRIKGYRLRAYGLTIESRNQILEDQNGRCAICLDRLSQRDACVDHDHETDSIRGILCCYCNWGLGHFKDDPKTMENAAEYIRKSRIS